MGESVMAGDKSDKEMPHLAAVSCVLASHSNVHHTECLTLTSAYSVMDKFFVWLFILFYRAHFLRAVEYKLCATTEHDTLCKLIEASRTEITCVRVTDSVDCLLKMQKKEADFGTFYPEEGFLAARFLGDAAVVLAEVRHPDRVNNTFSFETVAVVRKNFFGGLSALKGSTYCHPGFSKAQYWSDRVLKDFESRILDRFKDDIKCNSALRSAYEDDLYRLSMIFSKACRPGTWAVSDWWDKKFKREYHTLCDQCEHPTTCSYKVQNKGRHSDALRCLTLHGGNVTYTALEFVREYFSMDSDFLNPEHKHSYNYQFLCPDGSTLPLTTSSPCSWIKQPWPSVTALSTAGTEMQKNLKEWLAENKNLANHLRNILANGKGELKFRDRPIAVADYIKEGRSIPDADADSCRRVIRWCLISKKEKKKCEFISTAALTHGLPTQLRCIEGSSKIDCLRKVSAGDADVVYIDTELGYISRKVYNLTAAAFLETQRTGNYYGVVVFKGDSIKGFKDLQGKRACFPQYNGLGWLTYIEALKSLSIIPRQSCSNSKKAWNYFAQMCAPGAKDLRVNPQSAKAPDRLCKGCANANEGSSCEAVARNPYYGEVGALKCLDNDDGDVAFLDFHRARNHLVNTGMALENFKILCQDGSLENFNLTNPDKCSFTQFNGGEVVARKDLEVVRKNDIHHTLMELDDLFGTTSRSYDPSLKMFEPFENEANVLFKESAVSLVSIYETRNRFVNNYMNLLTNLDNCLGDSSSSALLPSVLAVAFSVFFIFYQY